MLIKIAFFYFIFINILAYALMWIDKKRAIRKQWRIPERDLFLSAAAGGVIGSLFGMYMLRHKTKHLSFTVGMPLILIIWIIGIVGYIIVTN